MRAKWFVLFIAAFAVAALSACGSGGGGSDVAAGDDIAGVVETVGITNCLTCHDGDIAVEWLASRHANNLAAVQKELLNMQGDHVDDPTPNNTNPTCEACHNPLGDGQLIDNAIAGEPERMLVGCESCHGGGSAHSGIGPLPFPVPGPDQCGQCHGITAPLFHSTSLVRNIADTHDDLETTPDLIEGYNVKVNEQSGCVDCHYSAHEFGLTINNQWARSAHAGRIKTVKEDAADAGGTFAEVKAAPVTAATGDGWVHYDWDATNRQSCQRCHTTTGLMNFLDAQFVNGDYDPAENDFSHLAGWTPAGSSGENEMLYCWGCHSDSDATLRDPGEITLDFEYLVGPEQDPSGERIFVVLPDKGNSNVCAACHSGRGNDTSIRDSYAAGSLSSRFAGHHAPTAGSLYAETIHTGFEFAGQDYSPVAFFLHDNIREDNGGPCVGCHMADSANHTFEAVEKDELGNIVAITNQALCSQCHGGLINPTTLMEEKAGFEDARELLNEYATNVITNYKDLDITASANRTTAILALNDYGVFQNNLYMNEEPCIYVHNSFYGKRLIFDSIDWLDNAVLDGTITIDAGVHPEAAVWLGTTRP